MKTYTFTKKKGHWYINLPVGLKEYNETEFTLVEKTGGALDAVACGECNIRLRIDTKPMKDAVVLELEDGVAFPQHQTSSYNLRNQKGKLVKQNQGLDHLSLFMFGELPERIYLCKK